MSLLDLAKALSGSVSSNTNCSGGKCGNKKTHTTSTC